jgi:hypothetical protein
MAQLTVEISTSRRWFFWPAFIIGIALVRVGLIRHKDSVAYWTGEITPLERFTQWLVDHAMRIEVR